jgi:F-type H+-transporting ATPase subunit gamma
MGDTLENLRRKIDGAEQLGSVVKTMKAVASSNIGQYELAAASLADYYNTISLGIVAYFKQEGIAPLKEEKKKNGNKTTCAIAFGSDLGLVGNFNDEIADFVTQTLHPIAAKKEVWAVGERIYSQLVDAGLTTKQYNVPNSVNAITSLVRQILIDSEKSSSSGEIKEFYIFHNRPKVGVGYEPVSQRWLPLDKKWREEFIKQSWPTSNLPQVIGGIDRTLSALIHEYLFVSLFRACAESLSSENASRLEAMQRSEKNIEDLLGNLNNQFNHLRQSSIDEELFDVISGFEALKNVAGK